MVASDPAPAAAAPLRFVPWVAAALLAAGCLLQILAGYSHPDLSAHAWGTDDAYISYRYARNLAAGRGLVFNPGERVEGFSNLLYVLLLAPAEALTGPDGMYAVSAGLNVLCAVAALALLARFARSRLGDRGAAAVAFLFALCPYVWVAVASGLETPLVLLLQIAMWILVERTLRSPHSPDPSLPQGERGKLQDGGHVGPPLRSFSVFLPPLPLGEEGRGGEGFGGHTAALTALSLVAVITVLARADGFVTPLLAAAYLGLRGRRRAAAGVAFAALATFGAVTAFRLAYYGWPLPNTYYAKIDLPLAVRVAGGARQLAGTGGFTGLTFYVLVVLLALLAGLARRRLSALPFPAFFAAGWMAYYVWVGGDVFLERFLLFLFPMGAFLLVEWLEKAHPRLLPAAAGLLLILQLGPMATDPRFAYRAAKYDRWVTLGRYLGRAHPGEVVAVDGAGKVPFFSDLPALDMLGLTDVHIGHGRMAKRDFFWVGHAKSDPAYVLARRPDLVASWIPEVGWLYEGPAPKPEALAAAGYRLIYLVNTDEWPKRPNVVDVRGAGPGEILRQLNQGYRYGVYGRERR